MTNALKLTRLYAVYIITFLCVWCFFRYYTPLALRVRHTYELPANACVNELTSDMGSFEAVREGLFVLFILLPFSICLMIWSREVVAWAAHVFTTVVLLAWSIVNLGFDINDLKHANVPPTDTNFRAANLARDPRWCLYHGGQPLTELICANVNTPCAGPAVDPDAFRPDTRFLLRFAFNILLIAAGLFALYVATVWKRYVVNTAPPASKKTRTRYQTLK